MCSHAMHVWTVKLIVSLDVVAILFIFLDNLVTP